MKTEAIAISTQRYEQIHGHKPNGYGLWYFQLPGGRYLSYAATYGCARRAAAADARRLTAAPPALIQLCP